MPILPTIKKHVRRLLAPVQRSKAYNWLPRRLLLPFLSYRTATLGDVQALVRLYGYATDAERSAAEARISHDLQSMSRGECALVAQVGQRIVGAALLRHQLQQSGALYDWCVFGVFVKFAYRGVGIGEGLVRQLLSRVESAGGGRVSLRVSRDNTAAIDLYRKLSFEPSQSLEQVTVPSEEVEVADGNGIVMCRVVPARSGPPVV